jgi:hypothetical protein
MKLTQLYFHFEPELIFSPESMSARSATGYMNYHLKKPAMTFEGKAGEEHGQLHAMALYTLLLAFGHKIDPAFETQLKNPSPKIEPKIYQGLPLGESTKQRGNARSNNSKDK